MSDNPISSVSRVEGQSSKSVQVQAAQVQVQAQKEIQQQTPVKPVEASAKEEAPKSNAQKVTPPPEGRQTNLEFRVDPKSNEVMALIVDKATNKVVATIPPDDIKKLSPGELMTYSA